MRYSALTGLDCSRCGRTADPDGVVGLCICGSPLLASYDLAAVARSVDRAALTMRPPTLWRYHELLPVRSAESIVSLGEGMTPLLSLRRLGADYGLPRLLMKDDGMLPTGTFKARGAAVGVSRAREVGARGIAIASNGNAGAAWATYAARAGLSSIVAMPADAPPIARQECAITGAQLEIVDGHLGQCAQVISRAVAGRIGLQDVSTLKEPYRIEGKKTMGFEIVEQLQWRLPDVIVYPTGGGVGLIGIHKALSELSQLGWIGERLPRLVAVQAAGCAPIVRAFEQRAAASVPWPDPRTIAFGLNVPKALGDFLVLAALYATSGTAIAVDDAEIRTEQRRCARREGAWICPEGAATLAAARRLRESGWLHADEEVVALNTGLGLKFGRI